MMVARYPLFFRVHLPTMLVATLVVRLVCGA